MASVRLIITLLATVSLQACAPSYYVNPHANPQSPELSDNQLIVEDGTKLPLRVWRGGALPQAIIVAVHGFNDYRRAFDLPGEFFAQNDIFLYAYDQRGFGEADGRGLWPGRAYLQTDLITLVKLVKTEHPGVPVYLLGDSMGGAVVAVTSLHPDLPKVDGIILNAPAVWGQQTFNVFYRMGLWLLAHTVPWKEVTGKGLNITVTDNIPLLKELSNDPLMIRETRIDALYGMVHLMDAVQDVAPKLKTPTLLLYGLKDEVIPHDSICHFAEQLQQAQQQVIFYEQGYHFLLRDLGAQTVWQDILSWVQGDALALNRQGENACSEV